MPTAEPPLLPCLKEFKWVGRADTVCRALWDQVQSPFMPWVAFGFDHPHTFEFINTNRVGELNTTAQEIEANALAALRERPAKWEPVDVDAKDGKTLRILTCAGDFFAAEHVLDPEFMRQAQKILKCSGLFVGVPRRGLLMATSANQDQDLIAGFAGAVAGQFSREGSALISPMSLAMTDGAIVGIFDAVAKLAVPDGEPRGALGGDEDEDPAEDEDPSAPYVAGMVSRNQDGSEDVHLMIGGTDPDRLAQAIQDGFMALLKEHAPRKEFSGHIQIVILGMTPPSARKHVPKVLEHLKGISHEMSRGKERRYRVSLVYQKDSFPSAKDAPSRSVAALTAAPARRQVFTKTRVLLMMLGAVGGMYGIYRAESLPSYPATIVYEGASLTRATHWERDGTAAAVYVRPGETMPMATLQLGIINSTQHATAEALLGWIQTQSHASPTMQRIHDVAEGNERCLVAIDLGRTFMALQLCQSGKAQAACVESDRELDHGTVGACLKKRGCFVELCDQQWRAERDGLDRLLTSFLTP
jgi:hypothetical protein